MTTADTREFDAVQRAGYADLSPDDLGELMEMDRTDIWSALVRRQDKIASTASRRIYHRKALPTEVLEGIAFNQWSDRDALVFLCQRSDYIGEMAARNSSCPSDAADQFYVDRYSNNY